MTGVAGILRARLRDTEPIRPELEQGPVPAHLRPRQVTPREPPPITERPKLPDRPITAFVRGMAQRAAEPVAPEYPPPGTPRKLRTEAEAAEIRRAATTMGRKGGQVAAARRAERMTPEERSASARNAARARWARGRTPSAGSLAGRPRTAMPGRPGCPGCGQPGTARGVTRGSSRRWLCRPCGRTWTTLIPRRKGVAEKVRAAVRGLAAAGVDADRIAAFACGMFAARYGWERAVAWAGWIRRIVAPEGAGREKA